MNEKIRGLAEQAGFVDGHLDPMYGGYSCKYWLEQFAQLIILECIDLLERDAQEYDNEEWASLATAVRNSQYRIIKHFGVE